MAALSQGLIHDTATAVCPVSPLPLYSGGEGRGEGKRTVPAGPCIRRYGQIGLLATLLLTGCVGLGPFTSPGDPPAPTCAPCQIVTTWQHEVRFAPDPAHGGAPTPGLMGRLYLFGPEIDFPLVADGSLMVELYDDRPRQSGGAPVMLEQWRLDKDTLRCLRRRDTIGWGYTLFLPWGSYKPAIGQVHLRLRYDPLKGPPLFTDSGPLTLSATPDAVPPPLVPPAARGASTAGKPAMLPPAAPAPSSNGQPGLDPGKLAR